MNKGVQILMSRDIKDLEDKLNDLFKKGYQISGGISVDRSWYIAVVTKPF